MYSCRDTTHLACIPFAPKSMTECQNVSLNYFPITKTEFHFFPTNTDTEIRVFKLISVSVILSVVSFKLISVSVIFCVDS